MLRLSSIVKRLLGIVGVCFSSYAIAGGPAKFTGSGSEPVAGVTLGREGGSIDVPPGSAKETVRVIFPPGALEKNVRIQLFRETGTLSLNSGRSGGVFLRIDAGGMKEFSKPVEIEVAFDRESVGKRMLQGYAIDAAGRLSPVTMKSMDRSHGKAVFSTLVPLLFTWVVAAD